MSARRPIERGDYAGAAEAARHFDAPICELACNQVGRAVFLEAQLGVGVDVTPDLLDLGAELGDAVDQVHGSLGSGG
jgi:hypothetical protein